MTLKLGTADVTKVYVGAIEAQKAYLGAAEVYSAFTPPTELTSTDRSAVDAVIAEGMSSTNIPGVLLSITGPEGYYHKAYGATKPTPDFSGTSRPLTLADHFRMASITKTFTGTALLMQVDRGLVSLDDHLETYVPGVPNGSTITMRHLMTMRSGVYAYTADFGVLLQILLNPTGEFSQAKALSIIKAKASTFTPGSQYEYNNSNAILVAAVVEAVTGRSLRDVFQQDIFNPLGMTETKWPSDSIVPLPAASDSKFNPELAGAAGALTTTIGDLTKWAQAIGNGTLLSSATKAFWHTTFPSTIHNAFSEVPGSIGPPENFRYGYFLFSFGSWIGHDGGINGFGAACAYDTVSGATITLSENLGVNQAFFHILRNIAAYLYPDSVIDTS